MADEQVQDTKTDQVQDTTPPTPDVQDTKGEDGNGKDNLTVEQALSLVDKANKDRSAANKGEIAAKKRAEKAEAKLKEIEDSKKDEHQKAVEKAEAEAKRAEAAEARVTFLEHKSAAADAGVLPAYREYAVSEFKKSDEEDPAEFFKSLKDSHPAFFNGDGKKAAAATAKGGASESKKPDPYAAQIAEHEEAIKTERDPLRLPALKRSLRYLKKKQAEEKGA